MIAALSRMWKPWFVYRPVQLWRRAGALTPPAPGYRRLRTSWGVWLSADPSKAIGRSILTTGVYDLAVSEALARCIDPGDTAIDAGAHIGYMTALAAVAAGPAGRVIAFEPNPELFAVARENLEGLRRRARVAAVELHHAAVGEREGPATLVIPPDFAANDGVARLATGETTGGRAVAVTMRTIDDVLGGDGRASVLKLDVEGAEMQALRGAHRALASRRIRHIVFEDHDVGGSGVAAWLRGLGYQVYALGWTMRGLALRPVDAARAARAYEAPSYLASVEPSDVERRCRPRGYVTLGGRLLRRCR